MPRTIHVLAFALVAAAAAAAASDTLPDRDAFLDAVAEHVRASFLDPELRGVDWEAAVERARPAARAAGTWEELASAANGALAELATSHTRVLHPDEPAWYELLDLLRFPSVSGVRASRFPDGEVAYVGIGLFAEAVEERLFVRAIVDGGPAARSALQVGDEIVGVPRETQAAAASGACGTAGLAPFEPVASFAGGAGKATALCVRAKAGGPLRAVEVVPATIRPREFLLDAVSASARTFERDGATVAYVRMWAYAGPDFHDRLTSALAAEPLASADALVLDLRDGWGGADPRYLNLFNDRVPVLTSRDRDGDASVYDPQWRKPVVLLVDRTSRSGKELLAWGFRRYGYGPVVGERTAGAVTGGTLLPLPGDALLYLAVRSVEVDGATLEGAGVDPDVAVPFDLPYAGGADPRLEAALARATPASPRTP